MEIPDDIKKILIAVDQLLEALPEEEIDKFINGPEFSLYKQVMHQIYGIEDDDVVPQEKPQIQPGTWERTQEQSGFKVEPVKPVQPAPPPTPVVAQPAPQPQQQVQPELKPKPLELKQPIERLKQPSFNLEKHIEQEPQEQTSNIVNTVEKIQENNFRDIEEDRESKDLAEFSEYLRTRRPEAKKAETAEEHELVKYINEQLTKGLREPDILSALLKVGWNSELINRSFEIAKDMRIRTGKSHVKKFGVDFM